MAALMTEIAFMPMNEMKRLQLEGEAAPPLKKLKYRAKYTQVEQTLLQYAIYEYNLLLPYVIYHVFSYYLV